MGVLKGGEPDVGFTSFPAQEDVGSSHVLLSMCLSLSCFKMGFSFLSDNTSRSASLDFFQSSWFHSELHIQRVLGGGDFRSVPCSHLELVPTHVSSHFFSLDVLISRDLCLPFCGLAL